MMNDNVDDIAAWQQPTAFKDNVTNADDWYGERTEDKTRHSVTTEARRQPRSTVESLSTVNDSASIGRQQQPAVDHLYSGSFSSQT